MNVQWLNKLPTDLANIVYSYVAQMNDWMWIPYVDVKTERRSKKVNVHCTKLGTLSSLLRHKSSHPRKPMRFYVEIIVHEWIIATNYEDSGYLTKLKHVVDYSSLVPKHVVHMYLETSEFFVMFKVTDREQFADVHNRDVYNKHSKYGLSDVIRMGYFGNSPEVMLSIQRY